MDERTVCVRMAIHIARLFHGQFVPGAEFQPHLVRFALPIMRESDGRHLTPWMVARTFPRDENTEELATIAPMTPWLTFEFSPYRGYIRARRNIGSEWLPEPHDMDVHLIDPNSISKLESWVLENLLAVSLGQPQLDLLAAAGWEAWAVGTEPTVVAAALAVWWRWRLRWQ